MSREEFDEKQVRNTIRQILKLMESSRKRMDAIIEKAPPISESSVTRALTIFEDEIAKSEMDETQKIMLQTIVTALLMKKKQDTYVV